MPSTPEVIDCSTLLARAPSRIPIVLRPVELSAPLLSGSPDVSAPTWHATLERHRQPGVTGAGSAFEPQEVEMRVLTGAEPNENISDADLAELYAAPAGTPWLRVGMVSTVDGSATGDDARTSSINNAADQRVFQALRSIADVIIVGAGTAKAEKYAPTDKPIVLVSRKAQVPESLQGAPAGSVYLATCSRSDGLASAREILGEEHILELGSHRVDLPLLKATLAERGWTSQLCEGGPHLSRDLVFQGCVDEVAATTVPRLVAGAYPRTTEGAPVDIALTLTMLLEDEGTLFGRWALGR